jgi:hypothetical protein
MNYDEFKSVLNALWKIKDTAASERKHSLDLWNTGVQIDQAIRELEERHKRLTKRFYEGSAFGMGDWDYR